MASISRWLLRVVAAVATVALLATATIYGLSWRILSNAAKVDIPPTVLAVPVDSESIAEGERIARIRGCTACHGNDGGGRVVMEQPMIVRVVAPNLTRLAASASDIELERAIRHGIGVDGRALIMMPSEMYRVLTDDDVAKVVAWVRSLSPVDTDLPKMSIGIGGRLGAVLGEFHPSRYYIETETIPAVPEDVALQAGHYIAWSSCTECHGGYLEGDGMGSPALMPMALAYSAEDFSHLMRTGEATGGRTLPMMTGVARSRFVHLRDDELSSLHSYLRSLPRPQ